MSRLALQILAISLLVGSSSALAQGGLFSLEPGKRIKGHAKLECAQCHEEGEGISRTKCLGCHDHKPLARRIRAGKGLHARKEYKKGCESCHLDHKGAKYNPIDWRPLGGQKRFDHDLSGYALEGAHRRQRCVDCHETKYKSGRTKFLGLDSNCLSCHEDVHNFQRNHPKLTECKVCHSFDARTITQAKGLRFNHGKVADFELKGRHEKTKCSKCHTSTKIFKMKDPPKRCEECHKDPHKNVYTARPSRSPQAAKRDCKTCHSDTEQKFKKGKFNHGKFTRFQIRNKHAKLKCTKCHEKTSSKPPPLNCAQCHKDDSTHVVGGKDRFKGRDCIQCHQDTGFKTISFNHKKLAKFSLGGKHGKISCTDCHRKKSKREQRTATDTFEKFKSGSCIGCHSHKNAHERKFHDRPKLCTKCHVPGSTNIKTPSHDELSEHFAQQGAHAPISCEKCHGNGLTNLKLGEDCSACHEEDDAHKGNLGKTCKECHFEGFPWSEVIFDHNAKAEFPLEGKHQAVSCSKCHSSAPESYKPLEQKCVSCHGKQDVHEGALGLDCGSCHDPSGGAPHFDHNTQTEFPLEEAHARADCVGCHYQGEPSPTKTRYEIDFKFESQGVHCSDCHGDPHGLRRGAACLGCHDQTDWMNVAGAEPRKGGKTARLGGADVDPKASALGPGKSGLLATVGARARDQFHDVPPFNLRGGHSRLECHRCHQERGDLQGFGKVCDTCHRQDDIHAAGLGPRCGDCHSVNAFAPARFTHTSVGFPLMGAHRMVGCKNCHSAGNYMGLSGTCASCHLDDVQRAARSSIFFHGAGELAQPCIDCHNQVVWTVSPAFRRRGL
jgi:Zn finger protein HypA/HybF involved in hydrogenase expression